MKDYMIISMWFQISIKLKRTVAESKTIITDMNLRFEKDVNFNLSDHHRDLIDAFNYYLDSKRYLDFD